MPPKRKVPDPQAASSSSSTTSTTAAPPPSNSTSSTSTSSKDDEILVDAKSKKHIKWYWAGESKGGAGQSEWIAYAKDVAIKLEKSYQDQKADVKIDDQRYVDLKKMRQRRYDDRKKRRAVNRLLEDDKTKGPSSKPPGRESSKAADSDSDNGSAKKKRKTDTKKNKKADSDSEESSESSSSESDDSDSDDDNYVKWSWAGDSGGGPSKGGGHQDTWVVYDRKMCEKLEKAFNGGKKKVKIDGERFVDLQNMLQRRYDDEMKRRSIKREDPPKKKAAPHKTPAPIVKTPPKAAKKASSTVTAATATTTTKKDIAKGKGKAKTDDSDEEDDEEEEEKDDKKKGDTKDKGKAKDDDTKKVADAPKPPSINAFLKCPASWSEQTAMDYTEVEVDKIDEEFTWMQSIFTNTIWTMHKTSPGLSPIRFSNLQVTRVIRIQNPALWIGYSHKKDAILKDSNGKCTPTLTKVATVTSPKGPPTDVNANEFFLFHGLNASNAVGITRFGFDPRFCSLNGMFGAGLYFAENSSKSNQYCHGGACTSSGFQANSTCKCAQSDELCMLVCRVTLGDALVEGVHRGNQPGDFWYNKRTEPAKPGGKGIYHSVLGESKANFGYQAALQLREYIVYESKQVYPEYKVYYKRLK